MQSISWETDTLNHHVRAEVNGKQHKLVPRIFSISASSKIKSSYFDRGQLCDLLHIKSFSFTLSSAILVRSSYISVVLTSVLVTAAAAAEEVVLAAANAIMVILDDKETRFHG